MDLLAKAYARSHYARQIPIYPKLKPLPPGTSLVADMPLKPAPRVWSRKLPGMAPWREETRGRRVIAPVPRLASIKEIISVVANELGVTSEQIRGNYRTRKYVFPRHVAQYLASRLTRQSTPIIARIFYRDHTSVLHAVRKIGRLVETDNTVRELVERLECEIRKC